MYHTDREEVRNYLNLLECLISFKKGIGLLTRTLFNKLLGFVEYLIFV